MLKMSEEIQTEPSETEDTSTAFHDSLSEETKGLGDFRKFKDVDAVCQSYVSLHKQQRELAVPGSDSTPEQREAFYSRIGRPASLDDYKFATIEDLPEEAMPELRLREFRQFAHTNGYNQEQAAGAHNLAAKWMKEDAASVGAAVAARNQDWADAMKKEQGEAYGQNVKIAMRARDDMKIPGLQDMLDETGTGNHPAMMNLFLKVGKMLGQHDLVAGETGEFKLGPEAAHNEIERLHADKEFMQKATRSHLPGHKEASAKLSALHEQATPET
jgi:hypothetical protein